MKKILVSSVIALCAMASQASYLAWQVGSDITADAGQSIVYDTANIYAVNSSGKKTLLQSYLKEGASPESDIKTPMSVPLYADITKYGEGYSYYIELSNYSNSGNSFVAGMVSNTSYANLSASITTDLPTASNIANVAAWHGGPYTAAPEPTSAILMLFGAAMLGLKRKNRSLN